MSVITAPRLVVLDVGHGNATFVHENSTTVLIDAASGASVLSYLEQQEITVIDLIILSHADQDHIGGLQGVLSAGITVKKVILNSDSEKDTETYRDLIAVLDDLNRSATIEVVIGLTASIQSVTGLSSFKIQVVMPTVLLAGYAVGAKDRSGKATITSNSISACVRVWFDESPVALLTGDMDDISLAEAKFTETDLTAPLLVFPHHGGKAGSKGAAEFATDLLNAVQPKTVIFSLGRVKHKNPSPDIVKAIRLHNAEIYIACTQLSMHCAKEIGDSHTHLAKEFAAGTVRKHCCAGTMVIDPRLGSVATPQLQHHIKFVDKMPTALCRQSVIAVDAAGTA